METARGRAQRRHVREKTTIDHLVRDVYEPKTPDEKQTERRPTTSTGLPVAAMKLVSPPCRGQRRVRVHHCPAPPPNGLGPWRRPTPAGILMFQKLTSRECSLEKGGVGTSSSDAKLGGIRL
jgi:hypothetical protein